MESNPQPEEVQQKHDKLVEDKNTIDEVEVVKSKWIANIASPFLKKSKSWDDETIWKIPEDIRNNIVDNLGFLCPSGIQAVSIPLIINEPYHSLIAQARTGCGKTGSFVVGSLLRVDRSNPNTQVVCIAHTRELVNQIHNVYELALKGTGITLSNFNYKEEPAQVIVTTHGKIEPKVTSKFKDKNLDLTHLRCIVIDEADWFFLDEKNFKPIKNIANYSHIKKREETNKVQWILFSATYPDSDEGI